MMIRAHRLGASEMAEDQLGRPQSRGHQLLQAECGRCVTASQFAQEGDARVANTTAEQLTFRERNIRCRREVNRLTVVTRGKHGQDTVPSLTQKKNGVDILAPSQATKSVDRNRVELSRHRLSTVGDLIEDSRHFKAIRQGAQGRLMMAFPAIAQANQSETEFHWVDDFQGRQRRQSMGAADRTVTCWEAEVPSPTPSVQQQRPSPQPVCIVIISDA